MSDTPYCMPQVFSATFLQEFPQKETMSNRLSVTICSPQKKANDAELLKSK